MRAISLMETEALHRHGTTYTQNSYSLTDQLTTQTSIYMCVWLAPHQLQPSGLSRYLRMNSDFGKAGSMELKFVLVHLRLTTSQRWQANKRLLYCSELCNKSYTNTPIVFC